jgi:WD40 repeat protein
VTTQLFRCFFFLLLPTLASAQTNPIDTRTGHTDTVKAIAFTPDGTTLASGGADQTVKLWSVATGKEIRTINTKESIAALAFSPDGKRLAVALGSLVLWDVRRAQKVIDSNQHFAIR